MEKFTGHGCLREMQEAHRGSDFGGKSIEEFCEALANYLNAARAVHAKHMDIMGATDPKIHRGLSFDSWRLDFGQKRVRIVHDSSARAFVDYETGNVLKCAGFNKPAKHARGNIYDEHHGAQHEGPHGPAYLR